MRVKHTDEQGNVEVHKGRKGGKTDCGFDTTKNPDHWANTNDKVTCAKNGCKN